MCCYSGFQGAVQCFMSGHGGSRCAPCTPCVAIQDSRVLINALWVAMEGPEALPVPHELLFRIPGCCSMLYEWHGGSRCAPCALISCYSRHQHPVCWSMLREWSRMVQRYSQWPMSCYSGTQGAVLWFNSDFQCYKTLFSHWGSQSLFFAETSENH